MTENTPLLTPFICKALVTLRVRSYCNVWRFIKLLTHKIPLSTNVLHTTSSLFFFSTFPKCCSYKRLTRPSVVCPFCVASDKLKCLLRKVFLNFFELWPSIQHAPLFKTHLLASYHENVMLVILSAVSDSKTEIVQVCFSRFLPGWLSGNLALSCTKFVCEGVSSRRPHKFWF